MSSKAAKSGFTAHLESPLIYPLYTPPQYDLHAAAASSALASDRSPFSRPKADDAQFGAAEESASGLSYADRLKRWSFEQERFIASRDIHSFSASPLLNASNDLLSSSGRGSGAAACADALAGDVKEGTGLGCHSNLPGLNTEGDLHVGFVPLTSSNTPFSEEAYRTNTNMTQYCTAQADMEILRANEGHKPVSGSVHLFEDIPSSLTHHTAELSTASDYHVPYSNPMQRPLPFASSLTTLHHRNNSELFSDHHHPWGSALRTSSAATNPHAELLLLPGISETVVEASPPSAIPEAALSGSTKFDLLHVSSVQDKQDSAMALPLSVLGETGRLPHPAIQWWSPDKLNMNVRLGLHENPPPTCTQLALTDAEHHASVRSATQSALSLVLQSPLQMAHGTIFGMDTARYNARSASGTSGVLRSSKYLKPTQQLLNECCNVCKDASERIGRSSDIGKSRIITMSCNNVQWSGTGGGSECIPGADVQEDNEHTCRSFFSVSGAVSDRHILQHKNDTNNEQQEKASTSMDAQTVPKQLPADERCHLQLRKARLVAMVEELDRRYRQYRDQMQLIVTSYESAAGMGGASPYTTLARKAMSRQFRGLRDAIGEHIRAVCRMLGEEVSSVPILSRGETPRLRLVDQHLRHQRCLQQIGMLPHQQAWRPQRGLPERSVSVLRSWLFEHFLHPYPKDSEKAMLARLTGLSRSQVSNWFINARVRLWKPMIEEMYIEESKNLKEQHEDQGTDIIINAYADDIEHVEQQDAATGSDPDEVGIGNTNNMKSMHWMIQGERQNEQATQNDECIMPLRAPAGLDQQVHLLVGNWPPAHYSANGGSAVHNELQSFIQFHSSARNTGDAPPRLSSPEICQSQPFSWMKLPTAAANTGASHLGDIGNILTTSNSNYYNRSPQQMSSSSHASALIQQQGLQLSSSTSNLYKNGVSLTLGLQQSPLHSTFNPHSSSASNPCHGRQSEAILF